VRGGVGGGVGGGGGGAGGGGGGAAGARPHERRVWRRECVCVPGAWPCNVALEHVPLLMCACMLS